MGGSESSSLHVNRINVGSRKPTCMLNGVKVSFVFFTEVKDNYNFGVKRNIPTLIEQIKQGWNGHQWGDEDIGQCEHRAVDSEMCQNFIRHSISELEKWIKKSGQEGSEFHPSGFSSLKGKINS